ncbi:MAG TPA: metal ABC transporter permease [bacterium]|mgnify:CR=1 FL=1|nr:metal ABC transporter permease [bacterium]HPP07750.1 metal ABC transporter permease [bacterium]
MDISLLFVPFIGCIFLLLLHTYFGVHVLERGIIFVDLTLAQMISVGAALAIYSGKEALQSTYGVLFAVIGALILACSKRISKVVYIEAFIGVLYIFSFSASILLLDRTPHGLEELKNILNGNILWITGKDLFTMFILYTTIGLFQFAYRKKFLALSKGEENSFLWEFLFFLSFALMLVNSIQIAGILQVFSFLIIPALIGKLTGKNLTGTLIIGWISGILASILGMIVSYKFDISTSSLIVAFLSLTFFTILGGKIKQGKTN